MQYDEYNREERYICAHLFRLLHQWSSPEDDGDKLAQFMRRSGVETDATESQTVTIFTEVSLINDAYFIRKSEVASFMDELVSMVATQQGIVEFRSHSELPEVLRSPKETHPEKIRHKAKAEGIDLTAEEDVLYKAIQAMFKARPDFAITSQNSLVAYEAKYTQPFDAKQISRTEDIAEIWAKLLYADLGFAKQPTLFVATIGPRKLKPQISWEWLHDQAMDTYPPEDRTCVALGNAVGFLSGKYTG